MDDGMQRDYYKECKYISLWFNRVRGNEIFLIFFKNNADLEKWIEYYGGMKIFLHYQYNKIVQYPKEVNKDSIIEAIIQSLMQIYQNGNISK